MRINIIKQVEVTITNHGELELVHKLLSLSLRTMKDIGFTKDDYDLSHRMYAAMTKELRPARLKD
jgi:hypothetical protein